MFVSSSPPPVLLSSIDNGCGVCINLDYWHQTQNVASSSRSIEPLTNRRTHTLFPWTRHSPRAPLSPLSIALSSSAVHLSSFRGVREQLELECAGRRAIFDPPTSSPSPSSSASYAGEDTSPDRTAEDTGSGEEVAGVDVCARVRECFSDQLWRVSPGMVGRGGLSE